MSTTAPAPFAPDDSQLDSNPARSIADRAGFLILASIPLFLLASSSAPTPLYAVYQEEWGFSPITTTVVFGVYAVAVLAALLTVGSLSDHVGRRPVLIVAVLVQAATMLLFAFATGVPELMAARVVQGLATGAALGAVGAALLDLDRARGTVANAVAPLSGTAAGALGSGVLVQYLPAPSHLVYLVLSGVFVVQAAGVAAISEPSVRRPGALRSLRPVFALPAEIRGPLAIAVPALIASWALAGFYGSLGPALVRQLSGSTSYVLGGLSLFALAAGAVVAIVAIGSASPDRMMRGGTATLVAGVGLALLAVSWTAPTMFFAATALAGAGFGATFQGGIRTVVPLAQPHERAGVLSVVFVVSYLAMGLPAVVGGYLVVHGGGLLVTAREYGLAVMALSAVALIALVAQSRRRSEEASPCEGPLAITPC